MPKPKWMRMKTYDRKLEEIAAVEEIVEARSLWFLQKLEKIERRSRR